MKMRGSKTQSSKGEAENRIRDEKIALMKERQSRWMAQRGSSGQGNPNSSSKQEEGFPKSGSKDQSSTKATKGYNDNTKHSSRRKNSPMSAASDVVLWTTKTGDVYPDSFVVRSKDGRSSTHSKIKGLPKSNTKGMSSDIGRRATEDSKHSRPKHNLATSCDTGQDLSTNKTSGVGKNVAEHKTDHLFSETNDLSVGKETALSRRNEDTLSETFFNVSSDIDNKEFSASKQSKTPEMQEFSSHRCPSCSKIMENSRNEPMICIPCGHSVCRLCASNVLICPICQCSIKSTSVNTSLKTVIENYKELRRKHELEEKEKEVRKYVEEYDTLTMRSHLLRDEAETVIDELETITNSIAQTKESMRQKSHQVDKTKSKIEELKRALETYQIDYETSQKDLYGLENQYTKSKNHLDILQDTIDTICKSKERVKFLVNSLAPSISFEDD